MVSSGVPGYKWIIAKASQHRDSVTVFYLNKQLWPTFGKRIATDTAILPREPTWEIVPIKITFPQHLGNECKTIIWDKPGVILNLENPEKTFPA